MPYTPEQMYDLVADVARYGEFLPWVTAVRIRSNSDTDMTADIVAGFKGLRETFSSKVRKRRAEWIEVDYIDGPLKYLHNEWTFHPDGTGSMVGFKVDFQFKNRVFEALAGQVFGMALRKMSHAFEERAKQLYGAPGAATEGSSSSSAHSAA